MPSTYTTAAATAETAAGCGVAAARQLGEACFYQVADPAAGLNRGGLGYKGGAKAVGQPYVQIVDMVKLLKQPQIGGGARHLGEPECERPQSLIVSLRGRNAQKHIKQAESQTRSRDDA